MKSLRDRKYKVVFPLLICLLLFTGCTIKANIKPYLPESSYFPEQLKKASIGKKIALWVMDDSGKNFVKISTFRFGNPSAENSDDFKEIIAQTAKRVLMDKGYKVSFSESLPASGEEYALVIDVKKVDIQYRRQLLCDEVHLLMKVRNQVFSPSGKTLLDYTFRRREKEEGACGTVCCAMLSGVGEIYLNSKTKQGLSRTGNKYLKEYAEDLASHIKDIL